MSAQQPDEINQYLQTKTNQELTRRGRHMHPHGRLLTSRKLLRKIAALHKSNHRLIGTGIGSEKTSFDGEMDDNAPSPCCSCLPHKKTHANAPQEKEVSSALSSCHSIGTGWFSPDTGQVVFRQPTISHNNTNNHSKGSHKQQLQQRLLSNPFLNAIDESPESARYIISAEKLLKQMELGETDGITDSVPGKLLDEHDTRAYYSTMEQLKFIQSGGAFYSFTCRTWMTPYERDMVKTMANLTCFEDETRDNFVPFYDIDNPVDVNRYTYVLQKAAYILPGVRLDDITPQVLSSNHYQESCQPVNGTKIWKHWEEDVFRFTRPIIPYVYKMTIQFKVSEVQSEDITSLSSLLGVRVDKAILMERTKRSVPPKVDATAKAKSILCYTAIPGGLLVTHSTVILNTAIPTVVAKVIHTFGGMGLAETCETAERTRLFFFKMGS